MAGRSWRWTDAHFCSLPSQTNIYGCTKIIGTDGINKLLVASLVGKIFTIEYQRIFDKLTPFSREVQFTYIPVESEIISIDAINQCCHGNRLIIGITFWKLEEGESKQFLNFYSASQLGEEFNIESVSQGCQSMELHFVPYHLYHTELVSYRIRETVFLLSGSDNKFHLYREVYLEHSFREDTCDDYFPELTNMASCALWLDIEYYADYTRRVSARGHQGGAVHVSVTDVDKLEVLKSFWVEHDSPVSYVKTFSLTNKVDKPRFLRDTQDDAEDKHDLSAPDFHLLVLSALTPATVYRHVLKNELSQPLFLPESNKYDTVLCGSIIDIDFDGENEIIIGTYGQEILAYKLKSDSSDSCDNILYKFRHRSGEAELSTTPHKDCNIPSRRVKSQENLSSSVTSDVEYLPSSPSKEKGVWVQAGGGHKEGYYVSAKKNMVDCDGCSLLWRRSFACPVIGMNRVDIMGDGMEDLAIVTLKGLHILQPDMNEVAEVCAERLQLLAERYADQKDRNPGNTNQDNTGRTDTDTKDSAQTETLLTEPGVQNTGTVNTDGKPADDSGSSQTETKVRNMEQDGADTKLEQKPTAGGQT